MFLKNPAVLGEALFKNAVIEGIEGGNRTSCSRCFYGNSWCS